jgi:hypothetical protein
MEIGDRVTNGVAFGEVFGLHDELAWVLVDGSVDPVPVLISTLAVVPDVPPVFEVGHNYVFIGTTSPVYHVVAQIDPNNFVVWFEFDTGGYSTSIAIPSQRIQVEEV